VAFVMIGDEAIAALERHPAVRSVRLVGSRADGTATALSDWDFEVDTADFPAVARDIKFLLDPLRPLTQQWDRLSVTWCWMVMLSGPVKLDFIFDAAHENEPPWQPTSANLVAIDWHFWDWLLWLASKQAVRNTVVVRAELEKLWVHILSPLGVASRPGSLRDAVSSYVTARDRLEQRLDVRVPPDLEDQVRPVIYRVDPDA
jgi:predicted nucleotidyltransferase